ncbi:MAG: methyltransferase domain-containing protein [Clostridiales bacterium]
MLRFGFVAQKYIDTLGLGKKEFWDNFDYSDSPTITSCFKLRRAVPTHIRNIDMKNVYKSLESKRQIPITSSQLEILFQYYLVLVLNDLELDENVIYNLFEYRINNNFKDFFIDILTYSVKLQNNLKDKHYEDLEGNRQIYYHIDVNKKIIPNLDSNLIKKRKKALQTHLGNENSTKSLKSINNNGEINKIIELLDLNKTGLTNIEENENIDISIKTDISYNTLPLINNERLLSQYSSTFYNERERLKVQGNLFKKIDLRNIEYMLEKLNSKNDIFVLDIGCANGDLTFDRFEKFSSIKTIFGVDNNEKAIEEAISQYKNKKYIFKTLNIETHDFEDHLKVYMKENGIESFDIVIGNYVVQHLLDPLKFVYKIKDFINEDGFICLRTSEDGSKVCYPDDNKLLPAIINMNQNIEGMSDRQSGRKLYSYLKKSRFKNIKLFYDPIDTMNKSTRERKELFFIQFIPRLNIMKSILRKNPDNTKLHKQIIWFENALEKLEIDFVSDEYFYYCEIAYSIIGKV